MNENENVVTLEEKEPVCVNCNDTGCPYCGEVVPPAPVNDEDSPF